MRNTGRLPIEKSIIIIHVLCCYFVFTATFPCLEPLILRAVRTSEAGRAMKLMYDVAGSLIETRMQRQEPLPVSDLPQIFEDLKFLHLYMNTHYTL